VRWQVGCCGATFAQIIPIFPVNFLTLVRLLDKLQSVIRSG
jgi:hypothetical protein